MSNKSTDAINRVDEFVKGHATNDFSMAAWREVKRLAETGAAVEAMPLGTSLIHDTCWSMRDDDEQLHPEVYEWAYEMLNGSTSIAHTPMAALTPVKEPTK